RKYVRREFADPAVYAARWQSALQRIGRPLGEQLRANGTRRAKSFDRPAWREQFARIIERVIDMPVRSRRAVLAMTCTPGRVDAAAGSGQTLVAVRLVNRGRYPETADGPGRTDFVSKTLDTDGEPFGGELTTPLPGLLLPGQDVAALVRAAVPE